MSDSPIKVLLRIGFHNDDQQPVGLLHGAIEAADRFEQQRIDFFPISDRSDESIEPFAKFGDPLPVVPGKRWCQAFPSRNLSNRRDEENVKCDGIVGVEASSLVDSAGRSVKGIGDKLPSFNDATCELNAFEHKHGCEYVFPPYEDVWNSQQFLEPVGVSA